MFIKAIKRCSSARVNGAGFARVAKYLMACVYVKPSVSTKCLAVVAVPNRLHILIYIAAREVLIIKPFKNGAPFSAP